MLVITRKANESFVIKTPHGDIEVLYLRHKFGGAQLGITAPPELKIYRKELLPKPESQEGKS